MSNTRRRLGKQREDSLGGGVSTEQNKPNSGNKAKEIGAHENIRQMILITKKAIILSSKK